MQSILSIVWTRETSPPKNVRRNWKYWQVISRYSRQVGYVCRALQLHDLVELLEKPARPRTLRPALQLKEIAKLVSYSNRPITFYSKVKIVFVGHGEDTFHAITNFFKKICPGSKISRSKAELEVSHTNEASEREFILKTMRSIQQYEKEQWNLEFYCRLEERKAELERRLQMNEELQKKKKKLKAHISSAFDKSWAEERGMVFMRLNLCIHFDLQCKL